MTRLITEHKAIIDTCNVNTAMRSHLNSILTDLPQIEADNPDLFE